MPAALGWHPWFRRRIDEEADSDGRSAEVGLAFEADGMFERDPDGISSRRRVRPSVRPWDDCFSGIRAGPTLAWPDGPTLDLSSSCPFWVVYDELPWAICVEPQTAPPNDLNHEPTVVVPGRPLRATMTWRWSPAMAETRHDPPG
jgi:aldose 1-epimerase